MCLDEKFLFHIGTWSFKTRCPNKSVMFKGKRKYEVSDPVFYNSLIARQKKQYAHLKELVFYWEKHLPRIVDLSKFILTFFLLYINITVFNHSPVAQLAESAGGGLTTG